jgi:hypothetical protein
VAHICFEEHTWAGEVHVIIAVPPGHRREGRSEREHAPRPAHLRIDRAIGAVRPAGVVDELPIDVRRELAHVLAGFARVLDPHQEPALA